MLNSGEKVGAYTVVAKLGAGGMGEVYRARDEKLGRDVALKVLRAEVAGDAQRMARFHREAQVLAALNHPNIAAIYGLEEASGQVGASFSSPESGQESGQPRLTTTARALVMELVEGPTLAERIVTGAIPCDEALPIAKQIAEALEYAHERNIIHRDLKPANIKLTHDAQVKVLDFGLAKALHEDASSPDVSNSPTLSMAATKAGFILGTAAYMSPEQARGRAVDRRTDIWAFGCVLFETLTGRHAFPSDDVSETLAAIIRGEPDWSALPAGTPAAIVHLLKRCLQKETRRRLQAIGEARLILEDYLANPAAQPSSSAQTSPANASAKALYFAWSAAAVFSLGALVLSILYFRQPHQEARVVRAFIPAPEKTSFDFSGNPGAGPVAISPDGRKIVFAARGKTMQMLWVQGFDSLTAQPLPGTENSASPFWAPDSRTVGFFSGGKLKKIDVTGGPPLSVCEAFEGRGGTWNRDGTIVFSPGPSTPLHVVSAGGGASRPITQLDAAQEETTHRWPHFLPDGQRFLYLARVGGLGAEGTAIKIASLEGGPPKTLVQVTSNGVFASGHLLFVRESTLMAQRFDPVNLELLGDAFPIAEQILYDSSFSRGAFSASENGVLIYKSGEASGGTNLVWFDRTGKQTGVLGDRASYLDPSISPDGAKVAVGIADTGPPDIWVYEIARNLRTRFTFHPLPEGNPVWAPESTRLAFRAAPKGTPDVYQKSVTGSGLEELLLESKFPKFPGSWSRDGRFLAYYVTGLPNTSADIWILPLEGERKPKPFLETPFRETHPQFSPDSRWIAYVSNESGTPEVYVTTFPVPSRKWQISNGGGGEPHWRRDGREIFYLSVDNKILAVPVGARGDTFEVGAAKVLFQTLPMRRGTSFDVTADGQRFLVNLLLQEQSSTPMTLVVNWTAGLTKK